MRRARPVGAWAAFVTACLVVVAAAYLNLPTGAAAERKDPDAAPAAASPLAAARPLANDCSGGTVHLTFDDGPNIHTPLLLDRLGQLHLPATFFVTGERVAGRAQVIAREVADGHSVQNHSYRHFDLVTGVDVTGVARQPWGESQIAFELLKASEVIEAAGAPAPTLYRPPYGSVDERVDEIARGLGLRLVMPWSDTQFRKFADGHDTDAGATVESIRKNVVDALAPGVIITMHDGEEGPTLMSIDALPGIVDAMNRRKLCASTALPADATGGALGSPSARSGRRE